MDKLKAIIAKLLSQAKRKKEAEENKMLILLLTIFFVLLVIVILVGSPIVAYEYLYQNKIYNGVYIDGINIGGLTSNEAIDKLNQHIDNLQNRGLNFYYQNEKANLGFTMVSPADPDLSFELLSFNLEKMVAEAAAYGRSNNWLSDFNNQLRAILHKKVIPLNYQLNEKELTNILKNSFAKLVNPGQSSQIKFLSETDYQIEKEKYGSDFAYEQALSDLKKEINLIAINSIQLQLVQGRPEVIQQEAEALRPQLDKLLQVPKFTLHYQDKTWEIAKSEYKSWLGFGRKEGQVVLIFKPDLLEAKLALLALEINVPAQDAKFVFNEGKVTEFAPSIIGQEVDLAKTADLLNTEFINNKVVVLNIIVKEAEAAIKTVDSNNLGIKELIGKGVSDFAGSHTNRIKNIKNAVNHLNGIIIPPGEFSIVDAIGEVNAATGYFQEFVIKGDRTIPEYGGGLCQIGTTVFRAALYSGLPITERRPHSYIVSYYKPLGMDATIYGPHPDLRFMNDTGGNILLQIKIEGTILTFEFWGSSDGRKVEITDPQLYNWTGVPADKLIENPKLKPGEKKLMETGRRGADSHFYRYITLPNGEKKEEIFRSHYVPWPNIYEVGVQPALVPVPTEPVLDNAANSATPSGQSGTTTQ